MIPYTSLIDWKGIHDKWMSLFKTKSPSVKFDTVEMVLRKFIIPFKTRASDVMQHIYRQLEKISFKIKSKTIRNVDVPTGKIYYHKDGKIDTLKYPDNIMEDKIENIMESFLIDLDN